MVVDAGTLEGVFIKTRQGFQDVEDEFLGFNFTHEGKSSLSLSFSQVLFERLVGVFFKYEGIGLITKH